MHGLALVSTRKAVTKTAKLMTNDATSASRRRPRLYEEADVLSPPRNVSTITTPPITAIQSSARRRPRMGFSRCLKGTPQM